MLQFSISLFALSLVIAIPSAIAAPPGGGPEPSQGAVAIAEFAGDSALAGQILDTARTDLTRSGLAQVVPAGALPLGYNDPIALDIFRSRGVSVLAVGTVRSVTSGVAEIRVRIYDTGKEDQEAAGEPILIPGGDPVLAGHRLADAILQRMAHPGPLFTSRLALVVKRGPKYFIEIADWDGARSKVALESLDPLLSLAWAPDGRTLAYTVIEGGRPVVYVQVLASGERWIAVQAPGSNSGPAWRPDGRGMAVVMSSGGGSRIHQATVSGTGWRRLLRGIDLSSEPAYSSDGRYLYFSSDQAGSAQIYRTQLSDMVVERITFSGDYNVSPALAPDNSGMAYVTRRGVRYVLAFMDLPSRRIRIVDDTREVESPSFSPDGRFVAYADRVNGQGVLAIVTAGGSSRLTLPEITGDVLEANWGPSAPE